MKTTSTGRPYVYAWCEAIAETDLPPMAKALAWRKASYASKDGADVRPTVKRLARDLSVSVSTVKRAKQILVERGWIVEVKASRHGQRGARATEYRLVMPADQGGTEDPPDDDQGLMGDPIKGSPVNDQGLMGEPLPAHDQPKDQETSAARATASLDDDAETPADEGAADAIVAHAIQEAGCDWQTWFRSPRWKRDRLDREIASLLREGVPGDEIYAVLAEPPSGRDPVRSWPGLLGSRLGDLQPVPEVGDDGVDGGEAVAG